MVSSDNNSNKDNSQQEEINSLQEGVLHYQKILADTEVLLKFIQKNIKEVIECIEKGAINKNNHISNETNQDPIHIQEHSDIQNLNENCNLPISQQLYLDKSLNQTSDVNIDHSSDNYMDVDPTENQVSASYINKKQLDISSIIKISNISNHQLNNDQDMKQIYKDKESKLDKNKDIENSSTTSHNRDDVSTAFNQNSCVAATQKLSINNKENLSFVKKKSVLLNSNNLVPVSKANNNFNDLCELNTEKKHAPSLSISPLHSKEETCKTKLNQNLTYSKLDIEPKLYEQHLSIRGELTPDIQLLPASKEVTADIPLSLSNELKPNKLFLLSSSLDSDNERNLPESKNIQSFNSSNIMEELVNIADNQNFFMENKVKFISNEKGHKSNIGTEDIVNIENYQVSVNVTKLTSEELIICTEESNIDTYIRIIYERKENQIDILKHSFMFNKIFNKLLDQRLLGMNETKVTGKKVIEIYKVIDNENTVYNEDKMMLTNNKTVESKNSNIDSENIVDNQEYIESTHNEVLLGYNSNETGIVIMPHLQEKSVPLSSCMEGTTVVSQSSLNNTAVAEARYAISTINLFTPKEFNSYLHSVMMYTDINNTETYHKDRNKEAILSYDNTEPKISPILYSDPEIQYEDHFIPHQQKDIDQASPFSLTKSDIFDKKKSQSLLSTEIKRFIATKMDLFSLHLQVKNNLNSGKEILNIIKEKRMKINQINEKLSFIEWVHLLNKSNKTKLSKISYFDIGKDLPMVYAIVPIYKEFKSRKNNFDIFFNLPVHDNDTGGQSPLKICFCLQRNNIFHELEGTRLTEL